MNVLVIDDSAYNRSVISGLIESIPGIGAVTTAVDGVDGYRQAMRLTPDLIMLDLEMPNMDGFTFLRLLKSSRRIPVIVITGRGRKTEALKAFELGALDLIEKPTMFASEDLKSIKGELTQKIIPYINPARKGAGARCTPAAQKCPSQAVVIGASTGGPKAVSSIVKRLPKGLQAPVIVCLHMPAWMTSPFIERLNSESGIDVRAAGDRAVIEKGVVLIAPGGYHLTFFKKDGALYTKLAHKGPKDLYAPAIDRVFSSAAGVWGAGLTGILMTGMGSDGREGVINIKDGGGYTIAESARSSLVSSMPDAAISTGKVDEVLSRDEIGDWIISRYGSGKLKLA